MGLPLEGVRILEMGQLIAVPHAVKMLADMGAQVVRMESHARLEGYRASAFYDNDPGAAWWNRGANFHEQNRNKLGLTLDLSRPNALDTLKELVSQSDVFIENFTPRVMRNFGLEYDDLRKLRPDIVFVSSTGYGFTGPWSAFGAIGPTTEAASGLCHSTGYQDCPPELAEMPYTDYTAAEHTVYAIMAALIHRVRTGQGQFVDVSQAQAASATAPETLMDYTINGRITERIGNRHPYMAPHGFYRCEGADDWIAIAVSRDDEWAALCETLGRARAARRRAIRRRPGALAAQGRAGRRAGGVHRGLAAQRPRRAAASGRRAGRGRAQQRRVAVRPAPDRARLLRSLGAPPRRRHAAIAVLRPPLEIRRRARHAAQGRAAARRAQPLRAARYARQERGGRGDDGRERRNRRRTDPRHAAAGRAHRGTGEAGPHPVPRPRATKSECASITATAHTDHVGIFH